MSDDSDMIAYTLRPNAKVLGPKYGPLVQQILLYFKNLNTHFAHVAASKLSTTGKLDIIVDERQVTLTANEVEVIATARPGFVTAEERGYIVALETTITPQLREEGLCRDWT